MWFSILFAAAEGTGLDPSVLPYAVPPTSIAAFAIWGYLNERKERIAVQKFCNELLLKNIPVVEINSGVLKDVLAVLTQQVDYHKRTQPTPDDMMDAFSRLEELIDGLNPKRPPPPSRDQRDRRGR